KRLLEYDEIMAKQRDAIYALRERFLLPASGEVPNDTELREHLLGMVEEFAELLVERHLPRGGVPEPEGIEALRRELAQVCDPLPEIRGRRWEEVLSTVRMALVEQLERQWVRLSPHFPLIARLVVLRTVDENWRQHLLELDDLREGIGLRAYGGTDPLVEFKREAHRLFQEMLVRSEEQVMRVLLSPRLMVRVENAPAPSQTTSAMPSSPRAAVSTSAQPLKSTAKSLGKVGRNDPCPCGSGKKYKHCCGKDAK
ncbi:MAG: SEC-C metal-binding domain-containing protein, partial [Candidatus Bipolaricaulota bacterium]|nr:SEC-C metal-binding domain-containing protein [Candidatus Bipolaricaulota bacterium]MDW8127402.1 SEC-C metal-binding domain-containing protein [Candidatus Bipolaricaulota bacterium]